MLLRINLMIDRRMFKVGPDHLKQVQHYFSAKCVRFEPIDKVGPVNFQIKYSY